MAIICNGSPKTGTHLLLKTIYLFGDEYKLAIHSHTSFSERDIKSRYINIFRSPRNVVGSWLKFTEQDVTAENYIKNIPRMIQEMNGYVGWWHCKEKNVLNVKYEELLTDPKTIKKISKFISKTEKPNHFKKIWGGTPTFTGKPFIWRDFWSYELEQAWQEYGGDDLENSLGYDPYKIWTRKKVL